MIITGLTGGIGHGKTTLANLLAEQCRSAVHFETWELVAEVATALRSEPIPHPAANNIPAINNWLHPLVDAVNLHVHVNLPFEKIKLTPARIQAHPSHFDKLFEYLRAVEDNPELATVEITDENKQAFRPLLQWLGGYLVIVGGGIWYDELVRRIGLLRSSTCELVTVGGVRYPDDAEHLRNAGGVIIKIERPDTPMPDARDLTERDRQLIDPDCIVINNGSLEQLSDCAQQIYKDLSLRQLQPQYLAQK